MRGCIDIAASTAGHAAVCMASRTARGCAARAVKSEEGDGWIEYTGRATHASLVVLRLLRLGGVEREARLTLVELVAQVRLDLLQVCTHIERRSKYVGQ